MLTALAGVTLIVAPASGHAYQLVQNFNQAESRDARGRITVEASVIHVIACNGAGENGGQFYIYQYVNRPGFRAIRPPDWGRAIGGRDYPTFQEAAAIACRPGPSPGGAIEIVSGTYGANCGQPEGNKTAFLANACNGRARCDYTIDHRVIGDPAYGCQKNYIAKWRCGKGAVQRREAAPEAGGGTILALSCGGN